MSPRCIERELSHSNLDRFLAEETGEWPAYMTPEQAASPVLPILNCIEIGGDDDGARCAS